MTQSKHTPAPWSVGERITGKGFERSTVYGETLIAEVYSQAFKDIENEKANAHLIAAAPELLKALQDVLPHVANNYSSISRQRILKPLKEAIAKAKGEM